MPAASKVMLKLGGLLLLGLLAACSSSPQPAPVVPDSATPLVGNVVLTTAQPQEPVLDLAVVVFSQGALGEGSDLRGGGVFPTVRKAETLLLPVLLAEALSASGAFPLVRVVHDARARLPLVLEAEIIHSDAMVLELAVTLTAADGSQLLARSYRDEASDDDYPVGDDDPFDDLYHAISNDVLAASRQLSASQRQELARLSLLDFGLAMAPDSFARFVDEDEDGRRSVVAFPAAGDPMLARLNRLRRQDDLFVDTVHDQYRDLFERVAASYQLWREYSYELTSYGESYRLEAQERKRNARRGTFGAMQQVYGRYRKVKIQEEDLRDLVAGFAGESLETVLEVDDGVVRLQGSVDERYRQWRQIMERIYALESGVPHDQP